MREVTKYWFVLKRQTKEEDYSVDRKELGSGCETVLESKASMRLSAGTAFVIFISLLLVASLPFIFALRAKYLSKIDIVSNYPNNALQAYCKNCTYTSSQAPGCNKQTI